MPKRASDSLPDKAVLLKRLRELEEQVGHMESDSDDSSSWPVDVLEDSEGESSILVDLEEEEEKVLTLSSDDIPKVKKEDEESISEDILALLGNVPVRNGYGENIHPELSYRVNEVLKEGLEKDERDELLKKHKFPENCRFIGGAKLNPEIAATLSQSAISRDGKISLRQDQVGAAISAVLSALNVILKEGRKDVITPLVEATRLLSDVQNQECKLRRKIILPSLDKKLTKFIEDTPVDDFLFGKNLESKIKQFKNVGRLGANIKSKFNPKNFKSPQPVQQYRPQSVQQYRPQLAQQYQPARKDGRFNGPRPQYRPRNAPRSSPRQTKKK